jgi:hypothetical protein
MSSELSELFERTLPEDEAILRRMAAARARRVTESPAPRWPWALAGVGVCVAGLVLVSGVPDPILLVEPERLGRQHAPPAAESDIQPAVGATAKPPPSIEPGKPATTARLDQAPADGPPQPGELQSAPQPATWEAAAQALRAGDQAEAERLLEDLAKSEDPEVRDGARLVRLRSLVKAHGPSPAERTELTELSTSGATASIRAAARKLLDEASSPPVP